MIATLSLNTHTHTGQLLKQQAELVLHKLLSSQLKLFSLSPPGRQTDVELSVGEGSEGAEVLLPGRREQGGSTAGRPVVHSRVWFGRSSARLQPPQRTM